MRTLVLNIRRQAAWKSASGRAGERGGALAGKPKCVSILTMTVGASMAAMILDFVAILRAVFEVDVEHPLEQVRPAHACRHAVRVLVPEGIFPEPAWVPTVSG